MTRSSILAVLLVLCPFYSLARESDDPDDLFTSSTLSGLSFRSIGPALTSGRVSDIAVHPDNHASQSGTGAHSLRIRVSTPWPQARQPPRTIGPRVTRMSWHTWQRWK